MKPGFIGACLPEKRTSLVVNSGLQIWPKRAFLNLFFWLRLASFLTRSFIHLKNLLFPCMKYFLDYFLMITNILTGSWSSAIWACLWENHLTGHYSVLTHLDVFKTDFRGWEKQRSILTGPLIHQKNNMMCCFYDFQCKLKMALN